MWVEEMFSAVGISLLFLTHTTVAFRSPAGTTRRGGEGDVAGGVVV